jgi:hypothetical protein
MAQRANIRGFVIIPKIPDRVYSVEWNFVAADVRRL